MPDSSDLLDTSKILAQVGNAAFNNKPQAAAETQSLDQLLAAASRGDPGVLMKQFGDLLDTHGTSDSDSTRNETGEFTFHYLENARFQMYTQSGLQSKLSKWGFADSMLVGKWRYEENCNSQEDLENLIQSFFKSASNRGVLNGLGIHILDPKNIFVDYEEMSTVETSMALFERLEDCEVGAVTESGHIKGRLDEYVGDHIINTVLKEVLLMEESDLYDTYTAKERKEFIFRIFKHLVIGGAVNQYDDNITDYLKATKAIYRDLVSAKKRDSDGEVEVTSLIFEVKGLDGEPGGDGNTNQSKKGSESTKSGTFDIEAERKEIEMQRVMRAAGRNMASGGLFKHENETNFCYLVIDKLMRHVTMWRYNYNGHWG